MHGFGGDWSAQEGISTREAVRPDEQWALPRCSDSALQDCVIVWPWQHPPGTFRHRLPGQGVLRSFLGEEFLPIVKVMGQKPGQSMQMWGAAAGTDLVDYGR